MSTITTKKDGSIVLYDIPLFSLFTLDNMRAGVLGSNWRAISICCHEFRNECWSNGSSVLLKQKEIICSQRKGYLARTMSVATDLVTKSARPSSCGMLNDFQAVVPAKRRAMQVRNAMCLAEEARSPNAPTVNRNGGTPPFRPLG